MNRHRRPLRVLLVDDNPLYAETLALLLGRDDRVEIVATAADGAEAVACALALMPDVVVMDVHMPVLDGLEATRRIRRLRSARVVVVTSSPTDEYRVRARAVGAAAFLPKDAPIRELLEAVAGPPPARPARRPATLAAAFA